MTATLARDEALANAIDAILPQTQCRDCGYPACKPYAQAMASGEAEINRCPPGGMAGVRRLADLLGRPVIPLVDEEKPKRLAMIDEAVCIGCTLCIQACPVDAIVGAARQMHTVVADWCTGCELCLAPCPVECIQMTPLANASLENAQNLADAARARYEFRQFREARAKSEKAARLLKAQRDASNSIDTLSAENKSSVVTTKQAIIAAAIERARKQREAVAQTSKQVLHRVPNDGS